MGSPAAPIQWFKDTKELSAGDDKYQMSHDNGVAKLQMVATELSDDDISIFGMITFLTVYPSTSHLFRNSITTADLLSTM